MTSPRIGLATARLPVLLVAVLLLAVLLLAVLLLGIGSVRAADDWGQFRGPHGNGSTHEEGLPTKWTETENIAWKAPLPGPSAATPAVWGGHVFVSSCGSGGGLSAIALDRATGKELWRRDVSQGDIRRDARSTFSSPSPATDGQRVHFFYGTGLLVTFDFAGNEVWRRDIAKDHGEFAFLWTFSTSPLLAGGKLYLQVLQRDTSVDGRGFADRTNESYLLALDAKSGDVVWKVVRPSEARSESREAFTTPILVEREGREELVVIGGDAITGHDPADGAELWRWETWNPEKITHWRHVPSPVYGDGVFLVCAPKGDPVYAIAPGAAKGQLGADSVIWTSGDRRELTSDVPTPAFADGSFFVLSDIRKVLARVSPKTGEIQWQTRTPGNPKYEASPLVADGKVYLVNFQGECTVVDATSGEILATNPALEEGVQDPVRASMVAAHGQLFVRTDKHLFCIGEK